MEISGTQVEAILDRYFIRNEIGGPLNVPSALVAVEKELKELRHELAALYQAVTEITVAIRQFPVIQGA